MINRLIATLILLILALAACQPEPEPAASPTVIPFPTATPGFQVAGLLPTLDRNQSNPAFLQPATPTPQGDICPPPSPLAEIGPQPETDEAIINEILRFLSSGGTLQALEATLQEDWGLFDANSTIRGDLDLTGDNSNEVIISYVGLETGGTLLIAACRNRRYTEAYRETSGQPTAPALLALGDINQNGLPDVFYSFEQCETIADDDDLRCEYRSQVAAWQPSVTRFTDLISEGIMSNDPPELRDTDDDQIQEIFVRLGYIGDIATGPLRTGIQIYDWNGLEYVLSIVQPDPLTYQVQIIHEADRNFALRRMNESILLYQRALTDEDLRIWLRNETPNLNAYATYRILLARTFNNEAEAAIVYDRLLAEYGALEPRPPFVTLAETFWGAYQQAEDLSVACRNVRDQLELEPDAVDFLNRYGERNPTYEISDLCPF